MRVVQVNNDSDVSNPPSPDIKVLLERKTPINNKKKEHKVLSQHYPRCPDSSRRDCPDITGRSRTLEEIKTEKFRYTNVNHQCQ